MDREFGTGIVKVTPAHDANDFASGQRHGLPAIVVIGPDGKMTAEAGEFAGLDRFEARKQVLARLTAENRLVAEEPYKMTLGTCQRCETVIEPYLSTQWFVKIEPLAAPAIEAVGRGDRALRPAQLDQDLLRVDAQHPRLVHLAPALVGAPHPRVHLRQRAPDGLGNRPEGLRGLRLSVVRAGPRRARYLVLFPALALLRVRLAGGDGGLQEFYPTDTLVTGYDILFFWVARMIMAGIHFTGRAPFSVVHLHGLVRVGGEKMSKTRGNVIDPLEAIAEFGADAVRFTLAAAAASGPTVSVERGRMAGSRNFATKLWNAARFTLGQIEGKDVPESLEGREKSLPDRWILSRLAAAARDANRHLAGFRFDEAAQAVYAFLWHELCDGYLEMVKPLLAARDGQEADGRPRRAVLARCLADSLALLHPFMPFVTEEIWEKMTGKPGTLIVAAYPQGDGRLPRRTGGASRRGAPRARHARSQLPDRAGLLADRAGAPGRSIRIRPSGVSPARFRLSPRCLRHLARLSDLTFGAPAPEMARDVTAGLSIGLSVGTAAAGADGARIGRTLAALDEEIAELSAKLQNPSFLDKAPPAVVEKTRKRLVELEGRRSRALHGRRVIPFAGGELEARRWRVFENLTCPSP